MRCVVYDPLDLEPLTVIDVPQHYVREIESGERPPFLRFPTPLPVRAYPPAEYVPLDDFLMRIAEVRFERFRYRNVITWVLMAMNPEVCLLMRSDLLPGQRRDAQQREQAAFVMGLLRAFE